MNNSCESTERLSDAAAADHDDDDDDDDGNDNDNDNNALIGESENTRMKSLAIIIIGLSV